MTLTVAMLIGALEAGTDQHTWRCPTREQIAYFRQLQAWNYPLSDVELLVLSPAHADEPSRPETGATDSTWQDTGQRADAPDTVETTPVITTGDRDLAA